MANNYSRIYKITTILGLLLAAFTFFCRFCTPLADWYSLNVYPVISDLQSWLTSWMSYNLQEPVVGLLILAAIVFIVFAVVRKWGFWRCLRYELTLGLWTYVWFYMGWCVNYSRSSIYERTHTQPTEYDSLAFRSFLNDYTVQLNASWTTDTVSYPALEESIKTFYAQVPECYGLAAPRSWHHPKRMWLNKFYSQSGILGFMAPLFAEPCLNADLLPSQYPSTFAHEYSHLLGVSNEAEANWWAYQTCVASDIQAVRYSGYSRVFSYVFMDAMRSLSPEEFDAWAKMVRPEIYEDIDKEIQHWDSLRSQPVTKAHREVYDVFLKSNNVVEGHRSYSMVVRLLIDLRQCAEQSFPRKKEY